jgi:hypothetical protein
MIVKETTNLKDIKTVLCDPDIYSTITDDDSPLIECFEPPLENHLYVGGYIGSKIVALMVYHKYLDGNACHVQVLPQFRKEYALKFGLKSLLFRGSLPLYAVIPDLYKNVLEFSFLFGFEVIKTTENTYIKNGQSYNDNILRLK